MKIWKIVTLTIIVASIATPLVAGLTTWLPPAIRTVVLALAPPAAVAIVLVVYFEWRAKLKSEMLADDRRDDEPVRAA
jgi:hypothetical protein